MIIWHVEKGFKNLEWSCIKKYWKHLESITVDIHELKIIDMRDIGSWKAYFSEREREADIEKEHEGYASRVSAIVEMKKWIAWIERVGTNCPLAGLRHYFIEKDIATLIKLVWFVVYLRTKKSMSLYVSFSKAREPY